MKINITNFQSINNKKADLLNLIESDKTDVIAGSETWLNISISSSEIFPQNYNDLTVPMAVMAGCIDYDNK